MHIYRIKLVDVFKAFPARVHWLPFEVSSRPSPTSSLVIRLAVCNSTDSTHPGYGWKTHSLRIATAMSSVCRWAFIDRLALSPVVLPNLYKAESGPNQPSTVLPSAGLLAVNWKHAWGEMTAGVLIFWFLNSVSACLLHPLCFLILLLVCALMCRENLPAVAQRETICKPRRPIGMFLRVHITAHHG